MTQPRSINPDGTPTIGPADTAAPTRVKAYAVLAALIGVLPVLAVFRIITEAQAASLGELVQAFIGVAGSFGFAFVAHKTNTQVKNGTFEPAPPPPADPVISAFEQIGAIKARVDSTVDQAQAKVAEGVAFIQGAAAMIPGGALVSNAVLSGPVGNLIQAVTDNRIGGTE